MAVSGKCKAAVLTGLVLALFTILFGHRPEVYGFAVDSAASSPLRMLEAPVHLDDDVMISLRAGEILPETGRPAYNRTDLAQPSTSYAAPYVFAALSTVLPRNIAVGAYALLGLLAVALTCGLLVFYSKSTVNGVLLAAALALTTTNLGYALNGWDHLYQAFFLTLAACVVLARPPARRNMLLASVALALGTLYRPDGLIISAGILIALYAASGNAKRFVVLALIPFGAIVAAALAINVLQFGELTPTTARLKVGASPSLGYSFRYLIDNGLFSYTAITLLAVFIAICMVFRRLLPAIPALAIAGSCLLTAAIAAWNSDYFPGARMCWSAACVMAALIATTAPAIRWPVRLSVPAVVLAACAVSLISAYMVIAKADYDSAPYERADASATARQYVVAHWINEHLDPDDGAIAVVYLGMGFHMPPFEIADILGKADEQIATTEVRWGSPGHNKWNIDATLRKWRPQAILPSAATDPAVPGVREQAHETIEKERDYAFAADIVLNPEIQSDFSYCYVRAARPDMPEEWGFFLRNEIAARHSAELRCR